MNIQVRDLPAQDAQSRLAIADCDLHLGPRSNRDLYPYLSKRWIDYIETYGTSHRIAYQDGNAAYPKSAPFAARRDAFPPDGSPPGTNLEFTRRQHLDRYNVQLGLINPPLPSQSFMNFDLGSAMCHALNQWQIDALVRPEPRLRASITINYEDPVAAVREIEHCATIQGYGHVMFMSRTAAPLGQRQYFPILEAAVAAGFPVAMHAFGFAGHKPTAAGWPSFYLEDMVAHANAFQAHLASLVVEGVFERLPKLRFLMIEGGFGWLPSFCWRLDKLVKRLTNDGPKLSRLPSEYIRSQVWATTQPMEEPPHKPHALDLIEWIGWDRLLFASDYPHWDFDDPDAVLPFPVTDTQKRAFYFDNARALYGPGELAGVHQVPVGGEALVGGILMHRRQHDAVLEGDATDGKRLEQEGLRHVSLR